MNMGLLAAEVEQLLQAARLHLAKAEFHEAVGTATEVINRDAKQASAYLIRAEAHRRLKRPERALADLAVAIRLDPHQPGPYLIRAEILKRRNQFDQAIADATHALTIDPRNSAAFSIRAECRSAIGDQDGATHDLHEMLVIDPTRPVPNLQVDVSSGESTSPADERSWKQSGRKGSDDTSLFADGKPVDKSYRSRQVVSDEDAPEALGVASGYKPGTISTPIPRMRAARKGNNSSWLWVLLGLVGAGLVGFLVANRGQVGQDTPKASMLNQGSANEPRTSKSPDPITKRPRESISVSTVTRPADANSRPTAIPDESRSEGSSVDTKRQFRAFTKDDAFVAHWVWSKGGKLSIEMNDSKSVVQIGPTDDLPQTGYQIVTINLTGINVSDHEVKAFAHLTRVEELNLRNTGITDAALPALITLTSLKTLNLQDTKITEDGLSQIESMTNLRSLNVAGLSLGTRGLSHVGQLTNLEALLLGGVQADDDAIGQLSKLTNLRLLGLHFNIAVSNAAIPKLKNLRRLETIRLKDTKISDDVVGRYLPGCKIER